MYKISILGLGNIGTSLLHLLVPNKNVKLIEILTRSPDKAKATIMELASSFPSEVEKVKAVKKISNPRYINHHSW